MGWEAWTTVAVVVGTVVVLTRDLVPAAAAVFAATIFLLVLGVIDSEQAFSGFSNEAPITVAALYVLARAVEMTGVLDPVVSGVLGTGGSGGRRRLARVAVPAAAASAFLNNTPIVAMIAPQVADWARRRGLSASPLLMPLSFAVILGGLMSAIGTSTNIVVSGLLVESGRPAMGMFEISRVGVPVALVGVALMLLLAERLLPERRAALETFGESVREFSVAMRVVPGGPLDGRSIEEGGLRHLQGVYCVQVDRDGYTIAPVAPVEVLHGGDVLTFVGKVDLVVDLHRHRGLVSTEEHHLDGIGGGKRQAFYEAVIGADSPLVNRTLQETDFRSRYQAAVLAIHRAGQRVDAKLGEVRLRVGDTLLLLADVRFRERWRETGDFLLVSRLGGTPPARTRKAPLVAAITLLLVLAAGSGLVPILHASLVAAVALVAAGALSPGEARNAVDLDVIVLIAASFGLGAAVSVTGLADGVAGLLVDAFAPFGQLGALAGVMVATLVLTELITNNAAAVLMFPIALSTAAAVGADARGFAMGVAVAASASFLTPIGYQTNTMVYGLGGYRFGDFARLGFPLTVTVIAIALTLIPVIWPF